MKLARSDQSEIINSDFDLFDRDPLAKGLLSLFSSSREPLVLALDEAWGRGKTIFARRLEKQARRDGFSVVYFDAFLRDYEEDVFISLASATIAELPAKEIKKSDFKNTAISVGRVLGKVALKGTVRLATAGAIKAADFSEATEEVAEEISDATEAQLDDLIDEKLSSLRAEDEKFSKFRESLTKLSMGDEPDKSVPLIFIIDELDRCRPDYSISVLETIKHFFAVPKVLFLLLCDFDHLVQCVRGVYGPSVNAELYLEKFVHARISFPRPDRYRHNDQIRKFIADIMQDLPDDGEGGRYKHGIVEFLAEISIRKEYSLRRIERILTQFGLVVAFSKPNVLRLGAVVYVLCDLKQTNRKLFGKAKEGTLTWAEIKSHYNFSDSDNWYERWLRYFYDPTIDPNDSEWKPLTSDLWRYNSGERSDTAKYFANQVVDNIIA